MLTEQQLAVVEAAEHSLKGGDRLKVVAGAGTGKTATLVAVAERLHHAGYRALYLAYNRAIATESRGRFGAVADVMTLHSFAYRATGAGRTGRRIGNIYPSALADALHLPADFHGVRCITLARLISATLHNFYTSDDKSVASHHVPRYAMSMLDGRYIEQVATFAQQFFSLAVPGTPTSLPLPHDLYLKAWQVRGTPGLDKYDTVLLDEAQDANPVIVGALKEARHAVFVGDPNQQIYKWRGAVNAMDLFEGAEMPLTHSFRWGQAIARVANSILAHKQTPPKWPLWGDPLKDSVVGRVDPDGKHTRIYRANNDLMQDALLLSSLKTPVALVGDRRDLSLALTSAAQIRSNHPELARHHLLQHYSSWAEVEADVTSGESASSEELDQIVRLVRSYGSRLDDLVELLNRDQDEAAARVTMTTAHRAKGREWDNVVVTQDFDRRLDATKSRDELDLELNLLYVAATRARRVLEIQSEILASYLRGR